MSAITFQLPAGPRNLAPIFTGVNFQNVEEYYLQLTASGAPLATTNKYKRLPVCCDEALWIFFVNYAGGIDSVPFKQILKQKETKSSTWKKALKHPLKKWDGGLQKTNVQSNEVVSAESFFFQESDQEWLLQVVDSPNVWLLWRGTQGQPDDYLPIVISDGKFVQEKDNERYFYSLQIEFVMSNDNHTLRN